MQKDLFCPISYSKNFKKIYSIKNFPVFMGVSKTKKKYIFQDLNWWINKNSGNVQIHPKVNLETLYFKSHGSGTVGKTWQDHHQMFFNLIKPYLIGNICEIGGGNNSVIFKIKNFAKIKKFYCFDKNLKLNRNHKKVTKVKEFFNLKTFKNKKLNLKFDLIIHSHTFEHLYNPDNFLNLINIILGEKGKHIFTMPNMRPMIKKGFANCMNFEHPFYFDEGLVDNLLKKNNFKILKKKFFKKNHSIMYVTEKKILSNKIFYKKYNSNFKIFQNLFKFWKNDINQINKKIKNHHNIFIFGAHIFSQMLLFNGLNYGNINGILDNDSNKVNNYLYGTNFKIYSPMHLKKYRRPIVILRAGAYNNEIKKDILKNVNSRTKFI